jgi:predicted nuclease of predicted toxin-antitoxin system
MRVILDECLPRRLIRDLHDHVVTTVPRQGWASRKNGELLRLVQTDFDVFITMDKSMENQQNLTNIQICIVVLHAVNSRYETIFPLIPQMRSALAQAKPGSIIHIGN